MRRVVPRHKGAQKNTVKATGDVVPQHAQLPTAPTCSPLTSLLWKMMPPVKPLFVSAPWLSVRKWPGIHSGIQLSTALLLLGVFCALPSTRAAFVRSIRGASMSVSALFASQASSPQIALCTIPAANLMFPVCRSIPEPGTSIGWDDHLQLVKVQGSWVAEALHETAHYPATLFRLSGLVHKLVYLAEFYLLDTTGDTNREATTAIDLLGGDINATYEALRLYKDIHDMSTWYV